MYGTLVYFTMFDIKKRFDNFIIKGFFLSIATKPYDALKRINLTQMVYCTNIRAFIYCLSCVVSPLCTYMASASSYRPRGKHSEADPL